MIHDFWRQLSGAAAPFFVILTALSFSLPGTPPAAAQTLPGVTTKPAGAKPAAAKPAGPTVEDLKKLVKTLETDAERKKFVETLKQLIAARETAAKKPSAPSPFVSAFNRGLDELGSHFVDAARIVRQIPEAWEWLVMQWESPSMRALWLEIFWKVLLAILGGIAAELLARGLLHGWRRQVEAKATETFVVRAVYLGLRTLIDMVPIAVFAVAAWAVIGLVEPGPIVSDVADMMILASVIARGIVSVARMLLAPRATSLRLFDLRDDYARATFRWVRRLTNIIVYPYFMLLAAHSVALTDRGFAALLKLLGLVVLVILIHTAVKARKPVSNWLRGRADDGDDTHHTLAETAVGRLADVWHIAAIVMMAVCYVTWVLEVEGGFAYLLQSVLLTVVVIVVARLLLSALGRLIAFSLKQNNQTDDHLLAKRARRYTGPAQNAMQVIIYFLAFLAILQAWEIDVVGWMGTQMGQQVLGSGVSILLILIIAIVVWELVSAFTERYLERLAEQQRVGERQARLRTLLPLMEKATLAAIIVVTVFIILSELGVNIAPLLAGAGVLGLAIGFGAQTLVKDVITGIFNIIEDTMAVGDVVKVAGHAGAVEDISIRSVVLRDYSGTVHTIPFSSISSVENFTKRFAYSVIDIGIAYREDADAVMEIIRTIGAALRDDAVFGQSILSDLEMAGVNELGDSAVMIRCRFKVRAGDQWGVRREMLRRVKRDFDERGIEIPYPHQTIYFGEDKDGNAPPPQVRMLERPGRPAGDKGEKPDDKSGEDPDDESGDGPDGKPGGDPKDPPPSGGGAGANEAPKDGEGAQRRTTAREHRAKLNPAVGDSSGDH